MHAVSVSSEAIQSVAGRIRVVAESVWAQEGAVYTVVAEEKRSQTKGLAGTYNAADMGAVWPKMEGQMKV